MYLQLLLKLFRIIGVPLDRLVVWGVSTKSEYAWVPVRVQSTEYLCEYEYKFNPEYNFMKFVFSK